MKTSTSSAQAKSREFIGHPRDVLARGVTELTHSSSCWAALMASPPDDATLIDLIIGDDWDWRDEIRRLVDDAEFVVRIIERDGTTVVFLVPMWWARRKHERDLAAGRKQPDFIDKLLMGMDNAMSDLLWNGDQGRPIAHEAPVPEDLRFLPASWTKS